MVGFVGPTLAAIETMFFVVLVTYRTTSFLGNH